MRAAVLVNGVPASGKSTIADALVGGLTSRGIAAVPLSLDMVKEGLFAHIGTGDRTHNRMLGRASYEAIFNSIAGFSDRLLPVVDAWHGFQPVEVLQGHLQRARIDRTVEVWVAVPPQVAAARYRARAATRRAGHPPGSYADELFDLAGRARPFGLGPVIEVDGTAAPDPDLAARVLEALGPDPQARGEQSH
ncbi:MAG: putative kinase [Rhodobacteraceae bacterium HLUCCA08]|nr:MAG: putative kinase [Rhodobacteraceae bacterium HLUCCA08]